MSIVHIVFGFIFIFCTLYSYVDSYTEGTRCQEIRSQESEARFLTINKKADGRYGAQ